MPKNLIIVCELVDSKERQMILSELSLCNFHSIENIEVLFVKNSKIDNSECNYKFERFSKNITFCLPDDRWDFLPEVIVEL
jgi:hypothetical protein